MKLREALCSVRERMASYEIPDAELEACALLMYCLDLNKPALFGDLERALTEEQEHDLTALVDRRLQHEPCAYILEKAGFFDLDLYVDHRVLIPRPETELLVEEATRFLRDRGEQLPFPIVADAGTGSGAMAIALAREVPGAHIYATDISLDALEVARANCAKHGVAEQVRLLCGDLLEPVTDEVDLIVANLPYVKETDIPALMPEVRDYEPWVALNGGRDGLDCIRRLLQQARGLLSPGGLLLIEIGEGQAQEAVLLAKDAFGGARVDVLADLAGVERVLRIQS